MTYGALFSLESTESGEILTPLPLAAGKWGAGRMRGLAVSGALARAVENALPDTELRPARWTLELCRVATMDACHADTRIMRQGRRITVVEADLIQNGVVVASARALLLRPEDDVTDGSVWAPPSQWVSPPEDLRPVTVDPRLFYEESSGWTAEPTPHSDRRNILWLLTYRIVEGEEPTPFQFAASAADVASLVGNWGSAGMQHINADVTLALARLPESPEIGMAALDRVDSDGITTSTVTVFDRSGTLGTAVVCALANSKAAIDPAGLIARA